MQVQEKIVAAYYQSDGDLADNAKEEEMFHTSETNGAEGCKEKDVTRGFSGCETGSVGQQKRWKAVLGQSLIQFCSAEGEFEDWQLNC